MYIYTFIHSLDVGFEKLKAPPWALSGSVYILFGYNILEARRRPPEQL